LERRLAVLTGGGPDLPRRQQTLRATLEWSVDLLQPTERAVFQRLAVFAGGWSVDRPRPPLDRLRARALATSACLGTTASPNWSVAMPQVTHPEYDVEVAELRDAMGAALFDDAWSAGRVLTLVQAIAEARSAVG
jgi:hypothetical protein